MFKILYLRPFNTLLFQYAIPGLSNGEQDTDMERQGPFYKGWNNLWMFHWAGIDARRNDKIDHGPELLASDTFKFSPHVSSC